MNFKQSLKILWRNESHAVVSSFLLTYAVMAFTFSELPFVFTAATLYTMLFYWILGFRAEGKIARELPHISVVNVVAHVPFCLRPRSTHSWTLLLFLGVFYPYFMFLHIYWTNASSMLSGQPDCARIWLPPCHG